MRHALPTLLAATGTALLLGSCGALNEALNTQEKNVPVYLLGNFALASADSSTDESSHFVGDVDEEDLAFQLGVELPVLPFLALSLAYADLGRIEYDGLWMGTPDRGTVETRGFQLAATGKLELGAGVRGVATAGGLLWDQEEREVFGGVPESDDESGLDPLLGLGAEYPIFARAILRLAYTRYFGVNDDDIDTIGLSFLYGL